MTPIVAATCSRPREESRSPSTGQAGGTQPRTAQEGAASGHETHGSRGAHAPAQQGHTGRPHAGLGAASARALSSTKACRRRLPASARTSLPLPAAPDAQRCAVAGYVVGGRNEKGKGQEFVYSGVSLAC